MPRPTTNIDTIRKLQHRYREAIAIADNNKRYATERLRMLMDYENQLNKPGFRYGERIKMGLGSESFVTEAGVTH